MVEAAQGKKELLTYVRRTWETRVDRNNRPQRHAPSTSPYLPEKWAQGITLPMMLVGGPTTLRALAPGKRVVQFSTRAISIRQIIQEIEAQHIQEGDMILLHLDRVEDDTNEIIIFDSAENLCSEKFLEGVVTRDPRTRQKARLILDYEKNNPVPLHINYFGWQGIPPQGAKEFLQGFVNHLRPRGDDGVVLDIRAEHPLVMEWCVNLLQETTGIYDNPNIIGLQTHPIQTSFPLPLIDALEHHGILNSEQALS